MPNSKQESRLGLRGAYFLRVAVAAAVAGAVVLGVACDNDDDDDNGADAGVTLTDGQIAAAMRTANAGEVQQGQLAQTRAVDTQVRAYADRMVAEHSAANTRLDALAQTAGIVEADSPVSQQLKAESDQIVATLTPTSGADFDRAYMDAQVTVHTRVLQLLDTTLIPQTTNAALRTELEAERAAVELHLAQARAIAASLAVGGADGGAADAGAADSGTEEPTDAGADAGIEAPDAGIEPPDAGSSVDASTAL